MKAIAFALWLGMLAAALAMAAEPGYSRSVTPGLVARYSTQFGQGAQRRIRGWQDSVRQAAEMPKADTALLTRVNRFVNQVPSASDQDHWGVEDYWATPAETFASNGGDCEDYAIAKYFALKELGIPVTRLRLVYARAWSSNGAHMVLAYYTAPESDPMILDNLEGGIRAAADRPDLTPVFSFNEEDLQLLQRNAPTLQLDPTSNRKWLSLLVKLQRELSF